MIELLRDPIWQFMGAFLAFLAIAVSYAIYRAQRQSKDLCFDIALNSPILTVTEEEEGKLQLLFDGHPIQDPRLLFILVENCGNTPISASDFERPISFDFGEGARVVSAVVTSTTPKSLTVTLERANGTLTLTPVLLNPRDSVRLKVLVSNYGAAPAVDCRVHGVHGIHPVVEWAWLDGLLVLVGLATVIMAFALAPSVRTTPIIPEGELPYLIATILGFLMLLVGAVRAVARNLMRSIPLQIAALRIGRRLIG